MARIASISTLPRPNEPNPGGDDSRPNRPVQYSPVQCGPAPFIQTGSFRPVHSSPTNGSRSSVPLMILTPGSKASSRAASRGKNPRSVFV